MDLETRSFAKHFSSSDQQLQEQVLVIIKQPISQIWHFHLDIQLLLGLALGSPKVQLVFQQI